ncbi:MAG: HAD family hydrolase [Longispora sp.]|nr:HAD family hydrolase [Longispora sp. (in: high G+C Gram-positive bacteria)]
MSRSSTPQVLIFDADDTLWENSVLFERVIEDFLDWLDHPTLERTRIREVLNDLERANVAVHGYGSKIFVRSLQDCFGALYKRPVSAAEKTRIIRLADALVEHAVDLFPGVTETLATLSERHELLLLTKGNFQEQQRKVEASQLRNYFQHVHIVKEKDVETYRALMSRHGWAGDMTWMIGNSPKSDILPARAAGLNAVFIPNTNTWVLEHAELDENDANIITISTFPDLLKYF